LKHLKWAILDDKIFEIKDFVHPGGNFILNHILGMIYFFLEKVN